MSSILVLSGGTSSEREVSLRSGVAVANALKASGHTVTMADPARGLEPLTPLLKEVDVVFPVLHGAGGEDGTLQAWLDEHSVRYVGSDGPSCAVTFDKAQFKQLMQSQDILTPQGGLVDSTTFAQSHLSKQPFVLKPADGGSSIDTIISRDGTYSPEILADVFTRHQALLLEELITGTEITIPVLGEQVLPVIEIIPPEHGEFDYENKYNGKTRELCPPISVETDVQRKAQDLALQVHTISGCRDMSRTDIIISDTGDLYVLEINTIPGMTDKSLVPRAANAAGMDMPALCTKLIELALKR